MGKKNYFWGIILILIGALLLADRIYGLNIIGWGTFWPFIIILVGLIFESGYFLSGQNAGLLVPGGILTVIGVLFLFETLTRWHFSAYTWPVYPFAVAVGLFQLYLFGGRESGLLIPVSILTIVAAVSMAMILLNVFSFGIIIGVALIVIGIYSLFRTYLVKK